MTAERLLSTVSHLYEGHIRRPQSPSCGFACLKEEFSVGLLDFEFRIPCSDLGSTIGSGRKPQLCSGEGLEC